MTRAEAATIAGVSRTRIGYLMRARGITAEAAANHVLRHRAGEVVSQIGRPPTTRAATIATLRERPGATASEVAGLLVGVSARGGARAALRRLHETGEVARGGSGRKGDPYRYEIATGVGTNDERSVET